MPLKKAPKKATARIAADSKYWLWINGEMVVFEGQLKRGPTPNDTYYDKVDLTPYLKKGDNTIAVLSWYFGKHGFSHNSSGKAGFVFEADIDGHTLLSNDEWKAIVHPAFGNTGKPHPNYRLPESNIRFDGGKDMPGWQNAGFDDSSWSSAVEMGVPPCAPWNKLVERPIPLWRDEGLRPYENAEELPKISTGAPIVAKLPRNLTISPYLKIRAPEGLLIDIRTDNYRGGSAYNVRSEYVTRSGIQEYESLGYLNGHEMIYQIPEGVEILSLQYRETRYDTDFIGSFECNDPFFNTLWMKARNTMNINMRDCIQDPDRERAQWWGDAVIVLGEMLYSCDTRSHGLIQKAILNLVDWQKPDGVLYSPIPAENWDKELPGQMLASIGEFGFWTYYIYTGDRETIAHAYPAVRDYLSLWQLGPDGLVVHRPGGWDWGDWGDNKDRPVMLNCWYYMALSAAVDMAEICDEPEDADRYRSIKKSIKDNFNKTFWDGREYRSANYKGETDDRGHGLAVVAGLAEAHQWPAISQVLQREFHASPYTEKYVLESLFRMNDPYGALERMKKRYRMMVESPVTTLWEGWGIGRAGYGGGSYNHGWAGGALTLLSQYAAGVAPVEVGYDTYHVLPQMGPLKHIKATVPSVKGNIQVEMWNEPEGFSLSLHSPANTAAIVGLPKRPGASVRQVTVNGKTVWKDGQVGRLPEGLSFVAETEHYIQ
ncbi:MAG: alpha-L-rhamnosidase C-terminal domain-containing protein, partial [Pseudohongiellaceae bacterium]